MTRLKKFKTSLNSNTVHPLGPVRLLVKANHQWIPSSLDFMTGVALTPQKGQIAAVVPPIVSLTNRSVAPINVADASTTTVHLQQRFCLKVWVDALQTLSILLYNTSYCVAFTWFSNWVFSRGNILTRRSVAEQSNFEFFAGTFFLVHSTTYWIMLITQTQVLMPFQFLSHSSTRSQPSFLFCLGRLLRHTLPIYLLSVVLFASMLYLLKHASAAVKELKPEFYICCLLVHVYVTGIIIAVRRIFQHETMEGQWRYPPGNESSPTRSTSFWKSVAFFGKAYVRDISKVILVCCAGLYIQLVSQSTVTGTWSFIAYTIGSLLLKTIVKEIAKVGIVKLRVRDPRSIFVVFGLPTVLIDTQMRIMLQRTQHTNLTMLWTMGMACIEIATRATKMMSMKRSIQRRERATGAGENEQDRNAAQVYSVRTANNFHQWKRQMLAFQIAESYANMSAEYIAIGCSTSILYFYWDHPKYKLSGRRDAAPSSPLPGYQMSTLVIQIVVEICVDYASCVLEIAQGLQFQEIRKYRRFLGLLFVSIATINVQICTTTYFQA
uniref:Uncharacterized protein n=1 Tax=Globisporangium ultimum (strain ATCC 200006 / CBS 805.95 / DAOM BR144) TaxID=431595 RepID=K3WFQ9_GLOUD